MTVKASGLARVLAVAALALGVCGALQGAAGGGPGFFRVTRSEGRFWLVDPEGQPFFSTGVNMFHSGKDPKTYDPRRPAYAPLRLYPAPEAWEALAVGRLKAWAFNTIGGWGDEQLAARSGLPYVVSLDLGRWVGAPWIDVAHPHSLEIIRAHVEAEVRPHRDDSRLIGYFVDNELGWYESSLFAYWVARDGSQRLKQRLFALLAEEYQRDLPALLADFSVSPRPERFESLLGPLGRCEVRPGRRPAVIPRFVELLADEYYETVARAVRAADPNHLLLGDRYASGYSQAVARASARHMDVVSVNYAASEPSGWGSPAFFDTLQRVTGKPLLVSEFYAAARENRSQNRNRHGLYLVVGTQQERSQAAAGLAERLARLPYVVGYHWFQWADQPPSGRSDGEDFNMGLVDLDDRPYEELTAALAKVNAAATELHRAGPRPEGLVLEDGTWAVPSTASPGQIDGKLDDWDLPRQWLPGAASPSGLPFGDFYLSWEPRGLRVGLGYYDYGLGSVSRHVLASRVRMSLSLGRAGSPARELVVVGLDERGPRRRLESLRPTERLPPALAPWGAQQARNLLTTAELLLPAALFGRPRLEPGDRLELGLRLSMAGDTKDLLWPAPPEARAALRLAPGSAAGAARGSGLLVVDDHAGGHGHAHDAMARRVQAQ